MTAAACTLGSDGKALAEPNGCDQGLCCSPTWIYAHLLNVCTRPVDLDRDSYVPAPREIGDNVMPLRRRH